MRGNHSYEIPPTVAYIDVGDQKFISRSSEGRGRGRGAAEAEAEAEAEAGAAAGAGAALLRGAGPRLSTDSAREPCNLASTASSSASVDVEVVRSFLKPSSAMVSQERWLASSAGSNGEVK